MKPDQERVKNLLTDTVSMLCRNGLAYQDELRVEGLIGITLDNNEVFLVHINQKFGEAPPRPAEDTAEDEDLSEDDQIMIVKTEKVEKPLPQGNKNAQGMTPQRKNMNQERRVTQGSPMKRPAPKPPSGSGDGGPTVKIKQEVKQEPYDPGEDPRVPPLHGQPDDQQQFTGPTSFKPQMSDGSGSDSSSYLLPNLQDSLTAPGFDAGDGSAWPGQPFPTAITRVNSDGTFESAPGTSGWSPGGTQGGGNQMANMNFPQAGQMHGVTWDGSFPATLPKKKSPARPRVQCSFNNCLRWFSKPSHLYRHQRQFHGMAISLRSGRKSRFGDYQMAGSMQTGEDYLYPADTQAGVAAVPIEDSSHVHLKPNTAAPVMPEPDSHDNMPAIPVVKSEDGKLFTVNESALMDFDK